MRNRTIMLGAAMLAAVFAAAPVLAQGAPPVFEACFSGDAGVDLRLRIDACTQLIDSQGLADRSLAVALSNRGTAFLNLRDPDRAIADYNRAIVLDPLYGNAYNSRGVAYQAKGDTARAMSDYGEAIRLNPADANAFNGRCWLRAASGDLQGALDDCNESLKIRPGNSNTLDSRGFVYLKLERWGEALADTTAALQANPRNAWALYERGVARHRTGDAEGGESDFAASRSIDPGAEAELAGFGLK